MFRRSPDERSTKAEFLTRVRATAEAVAPEARERMQQAVETLLASGADSFEDLLAVTRDPGADRDLRATACWVLGRFGRKRAAAALLAAFDEGAAGVQAEAAMALGYLESRRAVLPLIRALQTRISPDARYFAAHGLGWIRDSRAYEPLVSTLVNPDECPKVRGQAAEALAVMGAAQAVPALLESINDPSPEVRFWSIFALGQLAGSEIIPALERLAETETAVLPGWWALRKEATDAIVQIRRRAAWEAEDAP